MNQHPMLWSGDDLPAHTAKLRGKNFKSLRYPLWTQHKARLIEEYLRLFVFITKHGAYIDGFAAPQDDQRPETWAAKLVLEMEPKFLRDFWLCDISAKGVKLLEGLRAQHDGTGKPKRQVKVLDGDFNARVAEILASGRITEKTATFALLDQRTFECEWRTIEALSRHKKTGNKIELFYFFPTGWIDRSMAAVKRPEKIKGVEAWWGRPDWIGLRGMDGLERARKVANRIEHELGYGKAEVFPIHDADEGGRVMYHMIHASDHPEALSLMVRAYRKVSGRPDLAGKEQQLDLIELLRDIQTEPTETAK